MLALAFAAMLAAPLVPPAVETKLAACDAAIAKAPEDTFSWACYFGVALDNDAVDVVTARLEARLATHPKDDFARLYLAKLAAATGRDGAEPMFRTAIAGLSASGHAQAEMLARVSLVSWLAERGRHGDADHELALARTFAEGSGDDVLVATGEASQALLWTMRSEQLGRARELVQGVLARLDTNDTRQRNVAALALNTLGAIDREIGRPDEAAEAYARLAELAKIDGRGHHERRARYSSLMLAVEGRTMQTDAQRAALHPKMRELVADAQKAGDRQLESFIRQLLARSLGPEEAHEQYTRCLEISRNGVAPESEGNCMLGLAELSVRSTPDGAFALADQAFALAEKHSRPFEGLLALRTRQDMSWIRGDRDAAIRDSLVCIAGAEATRELHGESVTRARVHSRWSFAFHELAGRLLRHEDRSTEDTALAFNVLERMRARGMVEALDAAGVPVREPSEFFAAVAQARARTDTLDARFPTPPDIQAELGADEAMLAFAIASDFDSEERRGGGAWLIVTTRERVAVYPLPDGTQLGARAALYAGAFPSDREPPAGAAVRLYDDLLAQALADLPDSIDELVLVPDGPLHRLPFASLRRAVDGPMLVERYRLSQVPSAALWLRWRATAASPSPAAALVLADPLLPDVESDDSTRVAMRATGTMPLGPLPGTRAEASAIAAHLDETTRVLVGADASEAAIRGESLATYGILHLAAHTVLDDVRPERSGIQLAASGEYDGVLRVDEIVDLELDGKTVVLAACSSANGLALRGEGVMSIARGFFEAGATSVVASLWPLRDDVAAELFDEIYAELARGRSLSAAVATAQRARIARGEPPSTWAGLVVLGDGSVTPLPATSRVSPAIVVAAGLAAVLVFAAALRWRRRERA